MTDSEYTIMQEEINDLCGKLDKILTHNTLSVRDINKFFNDKCQDLPSKLDDITKQLQSQAIGIQNVYNEFLEIKKFFDLLVTH